MSVDIQEVQVTQATAVGLVHGAIVAVAAELSGVGIGKDHRNTEQKFNFRGIDDVLNTLSPLLAKHRLYVIPSVLERTLIEGKTKSGGSMWRVTIKVEYRITHAEDGSSVTGITYGEAMDSGDKATNKAISAAYKYFAIQAFAIPVVGTPDADADAGNGNRDERDPPASREKREALTITLADVKEAIAAGDAATKVMADKLSLLDQPESDRLFRGLTDDEYNTLSAAWPQ